MMADMSARRAPHSTLRAVTTGLLAAALATGMSGCSWHLEAEPVVYPSASQSTLERDQAARREQSVVDALGTVGDSGTATDTGNAAAQGTAAGAGDLAAIESQAAPAHLDALGGVYLASPSPTPSPFPGSLADAVQQARDGALETARDTADANLAFLQSSMGLTHAFALWWAQNANLAASVEATPAPSPTASAPGDVEPGASPAPSASPSPEPVTAAARLLPSSINLGESFIPQQTAAISPLTFSDLALAHDQARFLYEVIAARSAGSERDNALARRNVHAARADEFAALAGSEDRRQPLYEVAPDDVSTALSRGATARAAEFALGATYAAMLDGVADEDRGWILNAAFDAYAAGSVQLGFTPDEFPVLPGLEVTP